MATLTFFQRASAKAGAEKKKLSQKIIAFLSQILGFCYFATLLLRRKLINSSLFCLLKQASKTEKNWSEEGGKTNLL